MGCHRTLPLAYVLFSIKSSPSSLRIDILCWLLRHACNFVRLFWLTLSEFGYHIFQVSLVLTNIEPLKKQGQTWLTITVAGNIATYRCFFLIRISWKDPELNRLVFTMWQLIISAVLAWSTVSFSQHWQHVIFSVWAIKLTSKCADRSANSLQVDINIICWLLRHACNFVWLYWLTLCGFGYHIFQVSRVLTSIEPLNKQGQIWQSLLQETLQLIDVFFF